MLYNMMKLKGFKVRGTDGDAGKVADFFFDDEHWQVRYMVVATGSWLRGREVLVMCSALEKPDPDEKVFRVNVTMKKIETSPDVDLDKPLSRKCLADIHNHYSWPAFWPGGKGSEPGRSDIRECSGDPNLKSANEIANYHLATGKSEIGYVKDLMLDEGNWIVRYVLARTGGMFKKRSVLIPNELIKTVDWHNGTLETELTGQIIANSPPFDDTVPVGEEYLERLLRYYGEPTAGT